VNEEETPIFRRSRPESDLKVVQQPLSALRSGSINWLWRRLGQ